VDVEMTGVGELVEVASESLSAPESAQDLAVIFSGLESRLAGNAAVQRLAELRVLVTVKNGFTAFEDALKVFSTRRGPSGPGLIEWNDPTGWISEYDGLADELVFFAEDIFANQFAFDTAGRAVRFAAETALTEPLGTDLDDWARSLLADHQYLTGWPLAREWKLQHGSIPRGKRVVPRQPFVIGGDYSVDNLMLMEEQTAMSFYAALARQIKDLPEGTEVQLKLR
jgi:hypothetical protein